MAIDIIEKNRHHSIQCLFLLKDNRISIMCDLLILFVHAFCRAFHCVNRKLVNFKCPGRACKIICPQTGNISFKLLVEHDPKCKGIQNEKNLTQEVYQYIENPGAGKPKFVFNALKKTPKYTKINFSF